MLERHVFLSYARADAHHAARLDRDLQALGFTTWRDTRDLLPSQDLTGEIEKAIREATHVVACLTADVRQRPDSFVRREIAYTLAQDENRRRRAVGRLPLVPVVFPGGELPVHISTWPAIFVSGAAGYERGLAELRRRLGDDARAEEPVPRYGDPPELVTYLNALHEWTSTRLEESVRRLLVLTAIGGTAETMSAPVLALASPSPPNATPATPATEPKQFDSFDQALRHCDGRLLLLGAPGAGKTTTLVAFARDAAVTRLNDRSAPIPVLASVHTWDAKTPIPVWAQEQTQAQTGVGGVELTGQPLLYLLDGLDELDGSPDRDDASGRPDRRRTWFCRRLEDELSTASVVVSSRNGDGRRCHQVSPPPDPVSPSMTAVVLQPLEDRQIRAYLAAYGCSPLWQTLKADPSLLALARTPLLLSLFVYAFQGEEDAPPDLSKLDEASLFDRFVHRRFQHELERSGAVAFDEAVSREKLGQLAVWMWADPTSPRIHAPPEAIREVWGPGAGRFAVFGRDMHLLQSSGGAIRFGHLKLRDYCARAYLLDLLGAGDHQARADAARRLGTLSDPSVVPNLRPLWRDQSYAVRRAGAEALGQLGWRPVDPEDRVFHLIGLGRWRKCRALGVAAVDGLLEAMEHRDWHVRFGSARLLGQLRAGAAMGKLSEALQDINSPVRWAAARALGLIGDRAATPGLVATFSQDDKRLRKEAADALGYLGDRAATSDLIARLRDPHWSVRHAAAAALGKIREGSTLAGLLEARHDKDPRVRRAVLRAVARIPGAGRTAALGAAIADKDRRVRQAAVEELGRTGGGDSIRALLHALQDPDRRVHEPAARGLTRLGAPAVSPLRELLPEADWHVCRRVVGVLVAIGSLDAVPDLIARVADVDPRLRRLAVEALGTMRSRAAVPALVKALTDRSRGVRRGAAGALKKIGASAVPELVEKLSGSDREQRRAAADVLRGIGWRPPDTESAVAYHLAAGSRQRAPWLQTEAVPGLVAALRDDDFEVRRNAAGTLGEIGDPIAARALIDALSDSRRAVRKKAAEALRAIADKALPDLVAGLRAADSGARRTVARMLTEIGWQPPDVEIETLFRIAAGHWSRLIEIGEPAVSGLLAALGDRDGAIRGTAASVLVRIGGEEARSGLSALLRHERSGTRRAAARALDKMGWEPPDLEAKVTYRIAARKWRECVALGAAAVADLVGALADADPTVRRAAARALGEIGGDQGREALIGALWDQGSRRTAAMALRRMGWRPPDVDTEVAYRVAAGHWRICADLGVSAVHGLLRALADADAEIRRKTAWTLGKIGGEAALQGLFGALRDPAAAVRQAVVEAFAEIGGSDALQGVAAGLQDEDRRVRKTAVQVARASEEPVLLERIAALEPPDRPVSQAAKQSLRRAGDAAVSMFRRVRVGASESLELLRHATDGEWHDDVRSEVWSTLRGQTVDIPSPEWLDELGEHTWEPFFKAVTAMAEVRESGLAPGPVGFWRDEENLAYKALTWYQFLSLGNDRELHSFRDGVRVVETVALPRLLAGLQDQDAEVRRKAARSLGEIGYGAAVPQLSIRLLRDRNADVRRAVAKALGEIGSPAAIFGLYAGLRDEDDLVRRACLIALRRIGTPEALAAIDMSQDDSKS